MAKRIHAMDPADRAAAAQQYAGQIVRITYRRGNGHPFDQVVNGRLVGACYSITNGTSPQEVVLTPYDPNKLLTVGGAQYGALAISLANVASIDMVPYYPSPPIKQGT